MRRAKAATSASLVMVALAAAQCAHGNRARVAAPHEPTEWCWTVLPSTPAAQDQTRTSALPISLAVVSDDDLWIGWMASSPEFLHWSNGSWSGPGPDTRTRDGHDVPYDPVLAAGNGRVVAGWRNGGPNHGWIAQYDRGEWRRLPVPVSAYDGPVTNARVSSIAIARDRTPIVAWTESTPASGGGAPTSVHLAKWTGTTWSQMGSILDANGEAPRVALDSNGTPWIAWGHGRGVRVARWDTDRWNWMGELGDVRSSCPHRVSPRIAVARDGKVFVGWLDEPQCKEPGAGRVVYERVGDAWHRLALPQLAGRTTGGFDLIVLVDGSLVVAATAELDDEPSSIVLTHHESGRTEVIARAMQADPGQSDSYDVDLEPRQQGGFFLAWEENDGTRRTHVATFRKCEVGERPAPIPRSRRRDAYWPKSLSEAVAQVISSLTDESRRGLRSMAEPDLIELHMGMGMGIRNEFGLWRGNESLLRDCDTTHPDDCSQLIIERVWERLRRDER